MKCQVLTSVLNLIKIVVLGFSCCFIYWKCTKYEACASRTGFIFCSFSTIVHLLMPHSYFVHLLLFSLNNDYSQLSYHCWVSFNTYLQAVPRVTEWFALGFNLANVSAMDGIFILSVYALGKGLAGNSLRHIVGCVLTSSNVGVVVLCTEITGRF